VKTGEIEIGDVQDEIDVSKRRPPPVPSSSTHQRKRKSLDE
jgi:hypothetical protein